MNNEESFNHSPATSPNRDDHQHFHHQHHHHHQAHIGEHLYNHGNVVTLQSPKKSALKKVSKYGHDDNEQRSSSQFIQPSSSNSQSSTEVELEEQDMIPHKINTKTTTTSATNKLKDIANQKDLEEFEKPQKPSIDWNKHMNRLLYISLGLIIASLLIGFSLYFIVTEVILTKAVVPKPTNYNCKPFTDSAIENYMNRENNNVVWNSSLIVGNPGGDYTFTRVETSSVTYLNYFSLAKNGICDAYPNYDVYCEYNSPELFRFKLYNVHGSTKHHYVMEIGDETPYVAFEKSGKFTVFGCGDAELGSIKQLDSAISTSSDPSNSDFAIFSTNETSVLALVIDRYIYLARTTNSDSHKYIQYVYNSPKHGNIYPGERIAIVERHQIGTDAKRYWYSMRVLKKIQTTDPLFALYNFLVPYYYTLAISS